MCQLCQKGMVPADAPCPYQSEAGGGGVAASITKPSLSYDQAGDKIAEYGWTSAAATPISYAFRSTSTEAGFERFDANLITQSVKAFDVWSDIASIKFTRVGAGTSGEAAYSNDATVLLQGDTASGGYAWAYFPGSRATTSLSGDIFVNTTGTQFSDVSTGSYEFLALVHEIGHAIGLNHPGAYNGGSPTYASNAEYLQDSRQYTVMSYFAAENTGAQHGWNFASTPLLHDIAAAQQLYGANWSTRASDTTYGFNNTSGREAYSITSATDQVVFAIWDGGGNDTLDLSGYRQNQRVDLHEEAFSDAGGLVGNIAIARGAIIENASSGAGADTMIGNAAGNVLRANANVDQLSGEGGNDTLDGGSSNDLLFGGDGDDQLFGGAHKDVLNGDAGDDVLWGGSGDDSAYGGFGNDTLNGGDGADRLYGGDGADNIEGGSGDDIVFADAGNDYIVGGSGNDTIDFSAASRAVSADLQAHVAIGDTGSDTIWGVENVKGTAFADTIVGDKLGNTFWGLDGDDVFRGLGGSDTFRGGAGRDTYQWALKDVIDQSVHLGVDVIKDFSIGQDRLDVSQMRASGVSAFHTRTDGAGTIVQAETAGGQRFDVVLLEGRFGITDPLEAGLLV